MSTFRKKHIKNNYWFLRRNRKIRDFHYYIHISYVNPVYFLSRTNDRKMYDIYWWKNVYCFNLYDKCSSYKSRNVREVVLSININTALKKIIFDSYETRVFTFLVIQNNSFSVVTLLAFISDTLKIRTVSPVLSHRRYLDAQIYEAVSNLLVKRLVDIYNHEFKNS
jgi:hypothetical protein